MALQVARIASALQKSPRGPSGRRNGRSRGGDVFDLEGLAGGLTRWREQSLLE